MLAKKVIQSQRSLLRVKIVPMWLWHFAKVDKLLDEYISTDVELSQVLKNK